MSEVPLYLQCQTDESSCMNVQLKPGVQCTLSMETAVYAHNAKQKLYTRSTPGQRQHWVKLNEALGAKLAEAAALFEAWAWVGIWALRVPKEAKL